MKNRLRILYLIDSLATGGAERMAVRIANLMAAEHDVHLIATRAEGPFKEDISPQVYYSFLGKRSAIDWRAYWKLFRYIRKNKIQIIHAHSTSVFMALMMKWRLPRIKIVWHDHHGHPVQTRKGYRLFKLLANGIDYLISVSYEQLENDLEFLPIKKGVFLQNFARIDENKGIKRNNQIILLANIHERKNTLLALKAFDQVDSKIKANWKLLLVGKDYEDAYSRKVKDYIQTRDLTGKVRIISGQSNVSEYLYSSCIGILTSKAEGLPVALLEYGLAGLAVAATDVGGVGQLIRNGETGLLVPSGNLEAMAGALERLIRDEQLRKHLAANLHDEVQRNYSARAYQSRLAEIYKSLAG